MKVALVIAAVLLHLAEVKGQRNSLKITKLVVHIANLDLSMQ